MRIEETATLLAPQAGTRDERVGVTEGVPRNKLLLDRTRTTLAPELTVESVESFLFGVELVLVALDRFPREHGIQLDVGHGKSV